VPPGEAHRVWPRVAALIASAMRRGGLSAFAPVEAAVLQGRALLWLAWDGEDVNAAAVTEIGVTEWRKVCVVVACAGADMKRWLDLLELVEEFAKTEGCAAMRIMGRKGWARVLKAYRPRRVILEKEL
jgi:hypothetical protein